MTKSSVVLALVAVLLLGLVVPTGAAGSDQLWAEPSVVLQPHDGPNGQYAAIGGDGNLSVDLSSPGVNAGATTTVDDVFYVNNTDDESVAVWFSHAAMDEVVLSIDGQPAQGAEQQYVLAPGEGASVGVTVDATARSPGEVVLSEFTIHADDPVDDGGDGGAGGSGTSSTDEPTDDDGPAPTPAADVSAELPEPSGDDEVIFADGTAADAEIRSLPAGSIDELSAGADPSGLPRPVIDAATAPRTLDPDGGTLSPAGDADGLVEAGETLTLAGERTIVGDVDAIQPDRRVARLVEVDVPADRAGSPAYVRLAVDRSSLGDADPTAARIGRHTADGWQLLETRVVEADGERAVLEARTPGFSPFAVFVDPRVTYTWELPDGRTVDGVAVDQRFDRPGVHEVSLTVTDARGRTSSTTYRVLANDRPTVTIEEPGSIAPGEPATLRANVTNEVGNATVTWQFADGSTAVGTTVERALAAGEHVVRVEAVDEYGAAGRDSAALAVGPAADAGRVSVALFHLRLTLPEQLVYLASVLLLLVSFGRLWAERRHRLGVR